jgi:hypothetical protein
MDLNAAMGMPWEAGQVILRNIIAEIVKEEKRVKIGCVVETECAAQVNSRNFNGRLRLDESLDWPNGHKKPPA